MSAAPPIGRGTESVVIDRFLDLLQDGSRSLILEGEVGIGKTTLLTWARSRARDRGYRVLSAHPVEAEVPLEFAALADLLEEIPSAVLNALPSPQRRALDVAVFRQESSEGPVDPHTLASAVLTALRELAVESVVLLTVDDLPYLDAPSARVLSFVIRRARSSPIGLLATVRTEWPVDREPVAAGNFVGVDTQHVLVGALAADAIGELIEVRAPIVPSRSRLARIQELSQGNPLFALELAAQQEGHAEKEATHVPWSLNRLVLSRLKMLSASARDVLLVNALAAQPTVTVVYAAALDTATAEEDLEHILREGILRRAADDIAFSHPLIRSVAISDASMRQRRSAHQRLADAVVDREQRARHLALAAIGPDEETAAEVEAAAAVAASRGACDTAASLAGLAVRLTPTELADELQRRNSLEAEYCFTVGDTNRACELLERIVDVTPPGPPRAELLRRLSRYLTHRGASITQWAALLTLALDEVGDDVGLRASILVDAMFAMTYSDDLAAATPYVDQAIAAVEEAGDEVLAAQLYAALARTSLVHGEGLRRDLFERALRGPDPPVRLSVEMRPNVVIGHILRLVGDLDGARDLYEAENARVRREGVEIGLPLILGGLIQTETSAGNWERAAELGVEAFERAEESGSLVAQSYVLASIALLEVGQGYIEIGRHHARRSVELAEVVGMPIFVQYAAEAIGLAELSIGDAAAAHECLGPFVRHPYTSGFNEPSLLRFIPDDVEALIRLGDLDTAAELLGPFEENSVRLDRGSGIGASSRCWSLLCAAVGDFDAAATAIDNALVHHARLGMPFEHGRTLLVAGEVHRRARHKAVAKSHLERALEIFEGLGAPLWVQRTQDELDRLGLRRPQARLELTAAERRVADLAAVGLTNSQIATQLFMSPRTVEAHLSRVYRKLGVKSRTAMSRAHLAATDAGAPSGQPNSQLAET